MSSEKKLLTIIVEIETYDGEIQSVLPVDAETAECFSEEELRAIRRYLHSADDAAFNFMWDLRGVLTGENRD